LKRAAVFFLLVLSAVVLQSSILARITLFGVAPDLILIVVIVVGLTEGSLAGALSGFGGGLLRDLLLEGPMGLTGLAYLTVGYLVGLVRPYVPENSVVTPVVAVGLGSLLGSTLFLFFSFLLGAAADPFIRIVKVILLSSAYNTILTPFVYPIVNRVISMYPRERVYRW
jgi:rod shape-determining protein MreD